jgi:alkylation response protein AidB-like acyl-CoA dehydrogenase
MEFAFTAEQDAIRELAHKILSTSADPWTDLARADLLDVRELGFVEVCVVLEQVGRTVAPVPALPTLAAASALHAAGRDELLGGDVVLSVALDLDLVPYGQHASLVLVPRGERVAVVRPARVEPVTVMSGEPYARVTPGEAVDEIPADGVVDRALVASCAVQAGVSAEALRITAEYVSRRKQFGRPIGEFQAVQQRLADAYIDLEAMRWTMWQAAWRVAEGLPCEREAAIARFWASEAGPRIASTAQHVHGGIGVDLDYPIHRYFLWTKQLELTFGATPVHLDRLGETYR